MYKLLILSLFISSCSYFEKKTEQDLKNTNPITAQIDQLSNQILDSPKNAELYYQRGQLYWKNDDGERALNDFYKMTQFDSTKPQYYETLAAFFVDNLNIERGIKALDYAIKLNPRNANYHILQGKYSLYIQKYQDAINHLNNALKIDIHNPEAYFYKGYVYQESNNLPKAISNYTTAIEQDPTWDQPFEKLGEVYATQKNDLCLTFFDNASQANSKNTSAQLQKAFYLKSKGKLKEAIAIYETSIASNPQNTDAIYNLGVISYEMKELDKAIKQFDICIKVDPSYALAHYMIGKIRLEKGNKSEAKLAFENAYKFDTTMIEAKQEISKLK